MIKAIVFDMGGVLIDLWYDKCVASYKEIGFDTITKYLDPCHQMGFYGELEAGTITEEEFYDRCLSLSAPGTTRSDIDHCLKVFYTGPSEEKGAYLRELKERGYKIYMLSNNNPVMMRICAEDFDKAGISLDGFFDKLFISCWMKLLKPGAAIFEKTIEEIGLKPEEILFIDDSQRNVDGANACGIRAKLFVQGEELRETIEPELK